MTELLSPYRVLDLTDDKGMLCARLLGDLGADVIKIERPGGDPARSIGPFYKDIPHTEKSLYFFAGNLNKRSVTLDISLADGRAIFERLVKTADMLIESFPPGYMEDVGLGYNALAGIKPSLVMTSISGFGATGPYAGYKAPDLVAAAMGMIMSVTGEAGEPPVRISVPQSYAQASYQAALGTLVAHYHARLTGEGQHVDVSAMESLVWLVGEYVPRWLNRQLPVAPGRDFLGGGGERYPFMWQCKDGEIAFVLIGGAHGASANKQLADWMEAEGMLPDTWKGRDWAGLDFNTVTQEELDFHTSAVSAFFKSHTREELWRESLRRGIWIYPASDMKDFFENEQLKSRDFWVPVRHEELQDTILYPGAFAIFSETPLKEWRRPPLIGEHNREVYEGELGIPGSELTRLASVGVI